ncbi:hypothetical protein KSW89_02925 [Prevotella copri]|uniref:Single-stranded DNA-binding protein n=1 Tax=Segatella copri TaxID=165179 RepID=A0AAW4N8P2_9BACT|nr:hypothetical protein [Segatella copri]MBU9910002.1 hypothetical protein [Segatella copri]MBV3397758.1 hypothetical protein [Segatella copri]MBV3407292.1 hypothetical protein [Segatella copri]MBV3410367.1 hypothetical protein [Segatella copri]MBV3418685.1 hypothetical protein [Segatella copri]
MIKAEVKIIGTIKRGASIRTDKNNQPFLSFIVTIALPDAKTNTITVDALVSYPKGQQSDVSLFAEGVRVAIQGVLDIRNKENKLLFYLAAESVTTDDVPDLDAISGTLSFRGHLKKEKVYEEKKDKNGNPYLVFSAYSAEKVGESFVSTWVNFMRFPEKGAAIGTVKPDWMRSKAHVCISGELQISSYNSKVQMSCKVASMSEFVKENSQT